MHRLFSMAIVGIALTPILALGMGSDHKPGDLPAHDGWPTGVYDAVNQPNRVHGYWINSSDTLFYQGSHADLHKMIRDLVAVPDLNVTVVLHAGSGIAKSPWSEKPVGPADYAVTIRGDRAVSREQNNAIVDVWFGGHLTLAELAIPNSVKVKSGGEIEKFLREHTAGQEEDDGLQTDQAARTQIGEVLGRAIFQDEIRTGKNIRVRDELHRLFTASILEKYRRQHKTEIEPTEEEIVATTAYFNKRDPERINKREAELRTRLKAIEEQMERGGSSPEQQQQLELKRRDLQSELDTPGRFFALFILNNWKFQKHLYEKYGGGRVLWQQAGLEAFDAHREWLEALEKRGEFQITDPELRSTFYEYWTTMDHGSFLIGDKGRIERGFLNPEWLQSP